MGIEGIIFDFGGVMEPFVKSSSLRDEETRLGLEPGSLAAMLWDSPEWRQAELGAISDEEYWRRVGARLGIGTDEKIGRLASGLFVEVEIDQRMIDLVRSLGRRYRIGLLSNATDILPRLLRDHYRLDGLFDVEVISAMVGLTKPDPAIYELVLDRLGTTPEATIFIDDQASNVEAAAAMGIKAIHFVGHDALVVALQGFGVVTRH